MASPQKSGASDNPTPTPSIMDNSRLQQLITPTGRPAATVDTPSSRPPSIHTPTTSLAKLTVNSTRRSASARKAGAAVVRTPHGRAAIRLLDQRRAALFTSGGREARRRSIRDTRETPRDVLRNLSRMLAPRSVPIKSSSSPPGPTSAVKQDGEDGDLEMRLRDDDDTYDDIPIDRPHLSLPIDREDGDGDESDILEPPHSSRLWEDPQNFTTQSIELGRRAVSEQLRRSSLGTIAMSDALGDPDGMGTPEVMIDSGFFPPRDIVGAASAQMPPTSEPRYDADGMAGVTGNTMVGQEQEGDLGHGRVEGGNANETTVMLTAQMRDSPSRMPGLPSEGEDDEPMEMGFDGSDGGGGFDYDDDRDEGDAPIPSPLGHGMEDLYQADPDANAVAITSNRPQQKTEAATGKKHKQINLSRHGIRYPSLPAAVIKRLVTIFAKQGGVANAKPSPEVLAQVTRASDMFFQQMGDDLGAYAEHAGRKTIDESDVITLMKRQRQINSSTSTPFSLAQRHLPRELLQELRIPPPPPLRKRQSAARRRRHSDG